ENTWMDGKAKKTKEAAEAAGQSAENAGRSASWQHSWRLTETKRVSQVLDKLRPELDAVRKWRSHQDPDRAPQTPNLDRVAGICQYVNGEEKRFGRATLSLTPSFILRVMDIMAQRNEEAHEDIPRPQD